MRAVVDELAADGAQDGRLAAAGACGDQDVRGVGVQVDGDLLLARAEADQRRGLGHLREDLAYARVGQAELLGRGLALLDDDVRVPARALPGEGDVLQGELLLDEVGDQVLVEPQVPGGVDAYLRVVVGEVPGDVQVAARVGQLRHAQRHGERLVQRGHPLAHELPALAGGQPVRGGAHGCGGDQADAARLRGREGRVRVLPDVGHGGDGGVLLLPQGVIAAGAGRGQATDAEGQPLPPGPVGGPGHPAFDLRQDAGARAPERRVGLPLPVHGAAGQEPADAEHQRLGGLFHLLVELALCHGRALSVCVQAPHTRKRTPPFYGRWPVDSGERAGQGSAAEWLMWRAGPARVRRCPRW